MVICNTYSVVHLIDRATWFGIGTVFTAYFIAVAYGHVPIWIPWISDCGWQQPECYFFRFGIIMTGAHLYTLADYIKDFTVSIRNGDSDKLLDFSFFFMKLASVCLAIVAACDEKENGTVHGTSAIIFFAGYLWVGLFLTWDYWVHGDKMQPRHKIHYQCRCLLFGIGVITALVAGLAELFLTDDTVIIVCEWLGFLLIIGFNFTFRWDMSLDDEDGEGNFKLQAVLTDSSLPPTHSAMPHHQHPPPSQSFTTVVNEQPYASLLQPPQVMGTRSNQHYYPHDQLISTDNNPSYVQIYEEELMRQHQQFLPNPVPCTTSQPMLANNSTVNQNMVV